ncbi:hypothetical protein BS78_01G320300 [Paspalum vaginatum]|nr:hypothetical protein BS78_01G320300 [Paspalum vaginatum]
MLLSLLEIVEEYSNSNIEIHTFNHARGPFLVYFVSFNYVAFLHGKQCWLIICVLFYRVNSLALLPKISCHFQAKGNREGCLYSTGHGDVFLSLNYSGKLNILFA